jgi:dolichol-phosphate mannosyltransferase
MSSEGTAGTDVRERLSAGLLSIVIPVYNEERTLSELYRRLTDALRECRQIADYEVLFINDGSTDRSRTMLIAMHATDPRIKLVTLSRNFGHQMALSAGIDHASGDVIVLMDGDLQDPPELIPTFVAEWRRGVDVVYAIRASRRETWLKRIAFAMFYRVLGHLSGTPMPLDAGIFSLMDRRVAEVLRSLPERNRYLSGLRAWAGFRQKGVPCDRDRRFADQPRQRLPRLFNLAWDALFSFSYVPLRAATVTGAMVSAGSFLVGTYALYQKLFTTNAILGWASLLVATTFLCGLILLMLGILGEYLARIYDEVKGRPRYVVADSVGLPAQANDVVDRAVAAPR